MSDKRKEKKEASTSTSDSDNNNNNNDARSGEEEEEDEDEERPSTLKRYETDEAFEVGFGDGNEQEKPMPFDDERTLGLVLRLGRFAVPFFIVALAVPLIFIFIIYGVVPLGDPTVFLFAPNGAWVHILIVNPIVSR